MRIGDCSSDGRSSDLSTRSRSAACATASACSVDEHAPPMSRRVVLLHGLWMPGASMQWLAGQLRAQGFDTETFSYHSVADGPDRAVPRLVELLGEGGEADIVARSLGGLIALQALRETPDLPVGRVVCLGSPLTGKIGRAHV